MSSQCKVYGTNAHVQSAIPRWSTPGKEKTCFDSVLMSSYPILDLDIGDWHIQKTHLTLDLIWRNVCVHLIYVRFIFTLLLYWFGLYQLHREISAPLAAKCSTVYTSHSLTSNVWCWAGCHISFIDLCFFKAEDDDTWCLRIITPNKWEKNTGRLKQ